MRVCYIGNFIPEYSTENDVRKAFEHLGHTVITLQENQTTPSKILGEALRSDLLLITSTWDNALPLPEMLDVYKRCADAGIPTATLHLDTFWPTVRNGRKWWLNPMFHTAYIFTADGDHEDKWKALGKNHTWLPPAVRYDACHFGKYREDYACDVAFVGSNGQGYHEDVWPYRKELLNKLREICKRNGWSFKNPGGDMPKIDRGDDMNDFLASAKVTVGDSLCLKKEDSQYWSDRVPETTGRGGFLIMPKIKELIHIYNTVFPMYEWGDWADLENKIRTYVEIDQANIDTRVAMQEITASDHTYVNRVQTIIKEVGL